MPRKLIKKTCPQCGADFKTDASRSNRAEKVGLNLYCGLACSAAARQTVRKEMPCEFCGKSFISLSRAGRHGGRSRFCSAHCASAMRSALAAWKSPMKKCGSCGQDKSESEFRVRRLKCKVCEADRAADASITNGAPKTCDQCGSMFHARKSSFGLNKFCSRLCANAAMIEKVERPCMNCGATTMKAKDAKRAFCSVGCRAAHSIGPNNPSWRGGTRDDGTTYAYVGERDGFVSRSWEVHRIVASSVIGRLLTHSEHVIHIDNDKSNNQPENLFVCESKSEWRRRVIGVSLPWPTTSNLGALGKK